jgi:RNA polymerase sigma factor (sigma-70 family)
MKDYRLEIKIKNNYLFTKMQEYGIKNAAQLAEAIGSNPTSISRYLNLLVPAYEKNGRLTKIAKKLCDFFSCSVEELFPAEHLENALDKNIVVTEKNKHELLPSRMLETNDPSIALMEEEVTQGVDYLVSKLLNDREQKVIALSFGLRDEEPRSLEAIGELLGVSRTRIGQIQKKALRKLGAPFNRDLFEPFMKPSHFAALTERNKEKLKRQAEENERLLQGLEILHQTMEEIRLEKLNDY